MPSCFYIERISSRLRYACVFESAAALLQRAVVGITKAGPALLRSRDAFVTLGSTCRPKIITGYTSL